jgi:hypothetical protein
MLASAPKVAEHVGTPVRSDAWSVAPAANNRETGPVSDQFWPVVKTRSWPVLPSVKRKTAGTQLGSVGVFAVMAIRSTVIA